MRKLLLPCVLALGIVGTAYATEDARVIELKDGTSIVVFKDGKMSMRDKFGRAVTMPEGMVMETRDGTKVTMKGNEVWRLTTTEELNKPSGK